MSEQQPTNPHKNPRPQGQGQNQNNNRRHNNQRRRPQGSNEQRPPQKIPGGPPQQTAGQGQNKEGLKPQGGGNRRRNRPQHNRQRPPQAQSNASSAQLNIERIYEKYLNLLDQHLIARRKYHDLFYRADPAQKNKLERNFYNTLNEVREFESRLSPEAKVAFEKKNNGLRPDQIYTNNHGLSIEAELPKQEVNGEDPHLLPSQRSNSYAHDTEESVGTAEDYLKYKNLM